MTKTHRWNMDAELTALVEDFAQDCGRPFEEAARIALLNGMGYTMAIAMQRGESYNHGLVRRLFTAAQGMSHRVPMERHVLGVDNAPRRP